jgi:hypothetical protein
MAICPICAGPLPKGWPVPPNNECLSCGYYPHSGWEDLIDEQLNN